MKALLGRLRRRVAARFAPHPCARCSCPSALLYVKAAVRVVEGSGGVSIGLRVNHRTPPPEWLCRACAKSAMGW